MDSSKVNSANQRLAAIMFLDMVGYSRLMSHSAPRALAAVKELENIVHREIPESGGRLVKFMGDGAMAEFPTGVSAANCAQNILQKIAERNAAAAKSEHFEVRIGLHLGEVVDKEGDLFGDSVNIAARVQPLADPGGIAMSGTLYAQVRNQLTLKGVYLPSTKLKNIPERMKIFLIPPVSRRTNFWLISKRVQFAPIWARASLLLLLLGGIAAIGYKTAMAPTRLGLLYIHSEGKGSDPEMARRVENELNLKFASISGKEIQWVDRAGILDLFAQEGIEDPTAIERMEIKACGAARRGGLDYTLVCALVPAGKNTWRLDSKIVCTKSRSVIGSFGSAGKDADGMAQDLVQQFQQWLKTL